jgi:hypothetical protein
MHAELAVQEAPQSTALSHDNTHGLDRRLEAMEASPLGNTPHDERMESMGSLIQAEFSEVGFKIEDLTHGDGPLAVPGMSFSCRVSALFRQSTSLYRGVGSSPHLWHN